MGDRHQFRANWHHYRDGVFLITICSHEKELVFGSIESAKIRLSPVGKIVRNCITDIPLHFSNVEIWNYVIMPNHVHIVLYIAPTTAKTDGTPNGCLKNSDHGEACTDFHHNSKLAVVVGALKSAVTRQARIINCTPGPVWQSRFHDVIIRNKQAFDEIMRYVDNNVANWHSDCFIK